MVRARLLVSLERGKVGDLARKGNPSWFTEMLAAGLRSFQESRPGGKCRLHWRERTQCRQGGARWLQGSENASLSQGDDVEAGRRGQV